MLEERMKVGQYGEPLTHSLYAAVNVWAESHGLRLRTEEPDEWRLNRDGDGLLTVRLERLPPSAPIGDGRYADGRPITTAEEI